MRGQSRSVKIIVAGKDHCRRAGRRGKNPTPRPLPEAERGRKTLLLPLFASGRGRGVGFLATAYRVQSTKFALPVPRAGLGSLDDGEDVVLGHDEKLIAVDGDLVAGVGGE